VSVMHSHNFFASLSCPNPVTWTNNIQQLFTPLDVEHMKTVTQGALDLSDYNSVKIWATKIYSYVASMSPPGRCRRRGLAKIRGRRTW
jgi:hypothetical protein